MDKSVHKVSITGYGSAGDGIARLDDGRVVFIRGAARGDVCIVTIVNEYRQSCRAEIVEIIQPAEHRIEPDCLVYTQCGGCDFRHITYEEELWAKQRRVDDALVRIGGLSVCIEEIKPCSRIDGYRNKAVFHTARKGNETVIGFYRSGTHEVCPVTRCLLLCDELNCELGNLWGAPPPAGKEITLRIGRDGIKTPIEMEFDGLVFRISGKSFFQVNNEAALLLFQKAREYAALSGSETLVDLYCGVGSLTLFIGRDAGSAVGVENNPSAVNDARENARRNGFTNISFICADAADWEMGNIHTDCVIVDPPRRGLSASALRKINGMSPSRIVYISCDPATLARDIKLLSGYKAERVCVVDMFPRTANVECCVLLNHR